MAKLDLFSIVDTQLHEYSAPFIAPNKVIACRQFEQVVSDLRSNYALYPQYFDLVQLGTFDTETAIITSSDVPLFLCHASDFKVVPNVNKV